MTQARPLGWESSSEEFGMRTLIFIRHGSAGSPGRYIGQLDPPLDPTGRAQVERLAERLRRRGVRQYVASPPLRARQTAEALAEADGSSISLWDDLREISFGDWEGKTFRETVDSDPGASFRLVPHWAWRPLAACTFGGC